MPENTKRCTAAADLSVRKAPKRARFSLRAWIVLVSFTAIGLAGISFHLRIYRNQDASLAKLRNLGTSIGIEYPHQSSRLPRLRSKFPRVLSVQWDPSRGSCSDEDAQAIGGLPFLERLYLQHTATYFANKSALAILSRRGSSWPRSRAELLVSGDS